MIGIEIASYSAFGAPAMLAITGHPTICGVTVSRDLGDAASSAPTLRGVPCLFLDFVSADAADEALARCEAISAQVAHKELPTRLACSREVRYTLRLLRGFDEAAIATIAAHYGTADERYVAAQHDYRQRGTRRGRH